MKKTYIISLPDRVGSFAQVSRIIGAGGGNITRVNYNKAVDMHTLFLDVEAPEPEMKRITHTLGQYGFLATDALEQQTILVELTLPDTAGALNPALELLSQSHVNINYINSQADNSGFQQFTAGLCATSQQAMQKILEDLTHLCPFRVVEHDVTSKVVDSTMFYLEFARKMGKLFDLDRKTLQEFMVNANGIMQHLDKLGEIPFKTFEYLGKYAHFIRDHGGVGYTPKITCRRISLQVTATLIEPPCGSNSCVLDDGENLMIVDGGFTCYAQDLVAVLRQNFPDFDRRHKILLLTHGDIDHTGIWQYCDQVLVNQTLYDNFRSQHQGRRCVRESNPLHTPYSRISKIVTGYVPPALDKLKVVGKKTDQDTLSPIGYVNFGDLCFRLFQGNGGHVKGEMIFFDDVQKIMFTGDNLVNIRGFSKDQKTFNVLAPYLMTSVNEWSDEATRCRKLLQQWGEGYLVVPGHGHWLTL